MIVITYKKSYAQTNSVDNICNKNNKIFNASIFILAAENK